jgi:hypothetical protein
MTVHHLPVRPPAASLHDLQRQVADLQDVNERLMQLTETYLGLVAGAESVEICGDELRIHLTPGMQLRHLEAFGEAVNAMAGGHPVLIDLIHPGRDSV